MSNFHQNLEDELTVIVLVNIRNFSILKMTFELKEITIGVEVGERNQSQRDYLDSQVLWQTQLVLFPSKTKNLYGF